MTTIDWVIIAAYLTLILGIGAFVFLRRRKDSAEDYFLAGRHLGWFVVGA